MHQIFETGDAMTALDELQKAKAKLRKYVKACVSEDLISMVQREKEIQEKSPLVQASFRKQIKIALVCGVLFNVIITFVVAWAFSRQIVRRVKLMVDNSLRLTRGAPLNVPVGGGDEIAALDLSFHTMAKDLTEAQRKERALTDNAVDVICSLDKDGRFTAVNPACQRVFGYGEQELVGVSVIKILQAEDVPHVRDALTVVKSVKRDGATPPFESRIACKSGKVIDVSWAATLEPGRENFFLCDS